MTINDSPLHKLARHELRQLLNLRSRNLCIPKIDSEVRHRLTILRLLPAFGSGIAARNLQSHCIPAGRMEYSILSGKESSQAAGTQGRISAFRRTIVDGFLDIKQPWITQYLLAGGFNRIPTWEELRSGKFAFKVQEALKSDTELWESWLYEAIVDGDRDKLVPYIVERCGKSQVNADDMARLLASICPVVLRESQKQLERKFTFHPGAKAKIPVSQYPHLVKTAELLQPAILSFLKLPRTTRTLSERLQYLRKDHPEACKFLTVHIDPFQQALDSSVLLQRAKKSIECRARVLAEALAGSEYKLKFSTSRDRIRKARLLARNKPL